MEVKMTKRQKIQIIYPNCWKCGKAISMPERNAEKYFPCLKETTITAQVAVNADETRPSCYFYAKVDT